MAGGLIEQGLEQLQRLMSGRRVVPPVPAGHAVLLTESDDQPDAGSEKRAMSEALALFIVYVDAKGDESRRRITVRQLIGVPPTIILAFCHERHAPRNFRLDRIREAICPETGEVYDPPALLAALAGAGFEPIDPLMRRAINILVFLMRCDGYAHPAEWEAIDNALARFALRFGGGDAQVEWGMRMARQIAPDADDFLIGMRSFASAPNVESLGRWLGQAVSDVIDADGEQVDREFQWLAEVHDLLTIMKWGKG